MLSIIVIILVVICRYQSVIIQPLCTVTGERILDIHKQSLLSLYIERAKKLS